MAQDEVIKLMQGNQLPQYDIRDAEADEGDVFIDLERRDGTPYTCVHCGQSCLFAYDAMPRRCGRSRG